MREQRNPYKGNPPRPWVRLKFLTRNGQSEQLELLVDTGCPYAVVIDSEVFGRLCFSHTSPVQSSFGQLLGGWVRVRTPELGLVEFVEGYTCNDIVTKSMRSHIDFQGLLGLPLLRLTEYGGDGNDFWMRQVP